jgi:hypothetical protein
MPVFVDGMAELCSTKIYPASKGTYDDNNLTLRSTSKNPNAHGKDRANRLQRVSGSFAASSADPSPVAD